MGLLPGLSGCNPALRLMLGWKRFAGRLGGDWLNWSEGWELGGKGGCSGGLLPRASGASIGGAANLMKRKEDGGCRLSKLFFAAFHGIRC